MKGRREGRGNFLPHYTPALDMREEARTCPFTALPCLACLPSALSCLHAPYHYLRHRHWTVEMRQTISQNTVIMVAVEASRGHNMHTPRLPAGISSMIIIQASEMSPTPTPTRESSAPKGKEEVKEGRRKRKEVWWFEFLPCPFVPSLCQAFAPAFDFHLLYHLSHLYLPACLSLTGNMRTDWWMLLFWLCLGCSIWAFGF